jgi:hypothetical protein
MFFFLSVVGWNTLLNILTYSFMVEKYALAKMTQKPRPLVSFGKYYKTVIK